MKNWYYLAMVLALSACTKADKVNPDDVINNLTVSNTAPVADGTTVVYLSATLNSKTDAGKNSIIFQTSGGQFLTSATNDTLVTQTANYVNGVLTATIGLKMPMTRGKINYSATPSTYSAIQSYILKGTLTVGPSVPASLQLTPSALSIKQAFGSEIALSALLKNANKNNVSTGNRVVFSDYFPNGTAAGGSYRAMRDTTDLTSTVSTFYSIRTAPVPSTFYIKCTALDSLGKPTGVKDSCLITVTQ